MLMRGLPPWRETWRGGAPPWDRRTPLMGFPLLSYKRSSSPPSSHTLDPSLFLIVVAPPSTLLSEALPKLYFVVHTLVGVCVGVSGGSLLPLPSSTEGVEETSASRTCDRVRRRRRLWRLVHDLEIIKWTTASTRYVFIESSSAMFVREHKILLPVFEG
jgi:hypothetical protein